MLRNILILAIFTLAVVSGKSLKRDLPSQDEAIQECQSELGLTESVCGYLWNTAISVCGDDEDCVADNIANNLVGILFASGTDESQEAISTCQSVLGLSEDECSSLVVGAVNQCGSDGECLEQYISNAVFGPSSSLSSRRK